MCTRGVHASLASSTYGRGLPGRRSCLVSEHVLRGSPSPALWALLLRDRNSMVGPWPYTQQATTRGGGICGPVQPSNSIHGQCDTLFDAPSHSLTHQAVIRGGGICGPARGAERCIASFQLSYVWQWSIFIRVIECRPALGSSPADHLWTSNRI